MPTLKVGIVKVEITPPLGSRLMGYGVPERPAEKVHDPLYATALVFQQGSLSAAHVTLDVSQIDNGDTVTMRSLASQESGIPAEHINIGVIHTHSGPQTMSFEGWGDKDEAYMQTLIPKVAQAVAKACKKCVPVRVGIATIETKVGINRRGIKKDSGTWFGGNEFGPYDSTMTVVRFESDQGPVASLIHCSAHCTAMGCNRLISRDWAGIMVDRVESQTKAPVIFINGSYGDTGPRTNQLLSPGIFSAGTGDGIESVNEVGYRAASDALRCHQSIKQFSDSCSLNLLVEEIEFPLAPLPSLDEAQEKMKEWEGRKDEWGDPMCSYRYWKRVIEAHEHPCPTHRPFQQTIINIDPLVLVPMPGEPFASTALRLRQWSPFQYTLTCGGTNGMLCYLPDRESRHRGGYETHVSIGTLTHLLADNIDDVLVSENVRLLEKLAETN